MTVDTRHRSSIALDTGPVTEPQGLFGVAVFHADDIGRGVRRDLVPAK